MSMRVGAAHTVHFPPPTEPLPRKQEVPNVLGVYALALGDVEHVRETLRSLLLSHNRHEDLQAALAAARRVQDSVQTLLEAEEQS